MKFKDFVRICDRKYDMLKKLSARRDGLCGIKLIDITSSRYVTLKRTVPELFNGGEYEQAMYEILKDNEKNVTFVKISLRSIKRQSNIKKYEFLLWLQDQYEMIKALEQTYLNTPPDIKLINAGIRDLDILGDKVLIDSLAGGRIEMWETIENLPYHMIFDKQLKITIDNRITKKLSKQKD